MHAIPIQKLDQDEDEETIMKDIIQTYANAKKAEQKYHHNQDSDPDSNQAIRLKFQTRISNLFAKKRAYLNQKQYNKKDE